MGKEIERKYLVKNDGYKQMATARKEMEQGYLSVDPDRTVRIRRTDDCAFLTVKGRNQGMVRDEWEYRIPVDEAQQMLGLSVYPPLIKTRWIVPYAGLVWEVDEYHGPLEGLTVAEVELPSEDIVPQLPPFAGKEVTGDSKYYNSNLCKGFSD